MTIADLRGSARSSLAWGSALAAVVVVLSLGYPLVAPVFAIAGGIGGYRLARSTGSRWAWALFAVSVVVLVVALVVDLGLLSVSTSQTPGVGSISGS